MGFERRAFLKYSLAAGAAALLPACDQQKAGGVAPAAPGGPLHFPEKTADLILLTDRPPQLETPIKYFRDDLTPNDAFFVRWHLANIPTTIDTRTFRLDIKGHVQNALSLSLKELKTQFSPVSVVAVNQCAGNSRSLYQPRVPGGQWGHGAMGNANWTGVRLKDVLDKAGVKSGAVDISFQGLDAPPQAKTPEFVKSLDPAHAMDGEVMIAYEMNGAALPMLNGFPIRLIVPGWYGTYWVKALSTITVLSEKFHGFWMDKAYRMPTTPDAQETPDKLAAETVPIAGMSVRSIFVTPSQGEQVSAGKATEVEGVAFDGGKGIAKVEISSDAGQNWAGTRLDADLGKYSFRRWHYSWTPAAAGTAKLMVRATNAAGETQTESQWNRSGYRRNVMESVEVKVI